MIFLMKYISKAYRSFVIDEREVESEVQVWHDLLREVPFETAIEKTRMLCQTNEKWAPTPAEIYQACQPEQSYYALQRAEERADTLALQEYLEQAVPMPDHIRKRLEKLQSSRRLNHES
ncbi:replicative helicase loader/inhibitor [Paenibacillus polymyxa]|uniref:replicative helicase loader/inhibitor n=2 Tax=Paenibacillus polymyxa TaxID=1406 RepID=UPI002AB3DCE7|nr:replicative helicase loader/inhibitor [Paenibacillus polymyxa]MDY7993341.1 replicative helicase loader/inhibitor [Paenibacillus polymyxa]